MIILSEWMLSFSGGTGLAHIGCMSVCHCAKVDNRGSLKWCLKHALIMIVIYSALSLRNLYNPFACEYVLCASVNVLAYPTVDCQGK